jgi:hypothetical protein
LIGYEFLQSDLEPWQLDSDLADGCANLTDVLSLAGVWVEGDSNSVFPWIPNARISVVNLAEVRMEARKEDSDFTFRWTPKSSTQVANLVLESGWIPETKTMTPPSVEPPIHRYR